MREQSLRGREPARGGAAGSERRREEATRAARVDDERRRDLDGASLTRAFEPHRGPVVADALEARLIEVDRARGLRLLHQRQVEVGSIPVRVGHLVVGAGRDEQLARVVRIVGKCVAELVEEERESALETAGDVGPRPLPCAPLGEGPNLRQVVSIGQLLE